MRNVILASEYPLERLSKDKDQITHMWRAKWLEVITEDMSVGTFQRTVVRYAATWRFNEVLGLQSLVAYIHHQWLATEDVVKND